MGVAVGLGVGAGAAAGAALLWQPGAWPLAAFAALAGAAVPLALSGRPVAVLVLAPGAADGAVPDAADAVARAAVPEPVATPKTAADDGAAAQAGASEVAVPAPRRLRLDMVPIPGGRFWMGSREGEVGSDDDERPRHEVELSPFEMAKCPVTQRLYRDVMNENPSRKQGDELPVTDVSWRDAIAFCNRLSEMDGLSPAYRIDDASLTWLQDADGYRLPTEAEWEYAARGTDGRIYPWGNEPPSNQLCWDGEGNDLGKGNRYGPTPVGTYPAGASPFGLLDMAGNVWEWCWDRYEPYREMTEVARNSAGQSEGARSMVLSENEPRVLRGGSWFLDVPSDVRAADRVRIDVSWRSFDVGFRSARGQKK